MRCIICTEEPDKIAFRLTIVATAKEFEQLRDQLDGITAHPCSAFKYSLNDVLSQARKLFWSRDPE